MIKKLSPQIIREIAAGEVIERPASVLKELVENAIDAGAKRIDVSYEAGGLKSLYVEDDGGGVGEEELPLVFESHATSKLQILDDFNQLTTLGFRGEAISSIASVSQFSFETSQPDSHCAYRAQSDFGKWQPIEITDRRQGTRVKVENLFARLPVRQKFLKSASAEARAIGQVWRRYALIYPEIRWSLTNLENQKENLWEPSSFFARVLQYFSATEPKEWFSVDKEDNQWKLQFVGLQPRYLRPSRNSLLIQLNRRPIRDKKLEAAVRRAFEGYAERPHEVTGVLDLYGPAHEFDVNVHPTKSEVRFLNADHVFSFIVHQIRHALQAQHQNRHSQTQSQEFKTKPHWQPEVLAPLEDSLESGASRFQTAPALNFESKATRQEELFQKENVFELVTIVDRCFLVAKKDESLFLFDQHALHERVLYEELWTQMNKQKRLSSQRLLFPQKFRSEGAEELLEMEELLESLGFEIRQWEAGQIQILSTPAALKKNFEQALAQILECKEMAKESLFREAIATIACHSAIRANDWISDEEAQKILELFESDDALGHCPHGRPTFVQLNRRDLEKFFHRA